MISKERLMEIMKDCYVVSDGPDDESEYFAVEEAAKRILAALKEDERTEPQRQDSLQDQLKTVRELARKAGCYDAQDWIINMSGKTFNEERTEEPLAVLADRKGWWISGITPPSKPFSSVWQIGLGKGILADGSPDEWEPFKGETSTEAEAKAREYLNELPDKQERK